MEAGKGFGDFPIVGDFLEGIPWGVGVVGEGLEAPSGEVWLLVELAEGIGAGVRVAADLGPHVGVRVRGEAVEEGRRRVFYFRENFQELRAVPQGFR